MAEETYNTNKGMNYSFTPTLMEIEKTISLPMPVSYTHLRAHETS